ncbi:hypothetical protein ADIMK_4165 [Marinobacterium lacunae]|uniref:DUF3012 domain-containing protein n=1 Tax=Marinobacterium lacunae TaxID=1232683 RepID=A0A081FT53_9GAMM|nr:DUF3012 domain-containing protein [Marinobacterium lacunae]KEA61708.1 hypothetical protein ADIMK_4165 [Marinobacterium lacunae]
MNIAQKGFGKAALVASSLAAVLLITGCSPKVGSPEWCADMKEKPKGEWTANELGDFTKHCLLP